MMQTPQAAAAALTAAVMHAVTPTRQQAGNQNYPQPSQANTLQTTYSSQPQAAPQQTSYSSSGFAMQMSTPQWVVPQFQSPSAPPPSLTEGMPDPSAVERQKAGYLKTLEEQRQHYIQVLDGQRKEHLGSVYDQANAAKKQFLMQLEQQVKEQTIGLEKQYSEQVMLLNQQFHQQRGLLEQEAIKLKGEYQQKQLEEQAMQRQFQLQKERCEMEQKYAADMQVLQQQQYQMNEKIGQEAAMCGAPASVQFQAAQGSSYAAPSYATQGMGSYAPPVTMQQGSCLPQATGAGSYVPPVTMQAQPGSYVPPATGIGSYVPPVTMIETQQGSYVPPSMGLPPNMGGSYVPPPTVVSYVPPEPVMGSATAYCESHYMSSSAASTELAGSYLPSAVTQPQPPNYHGQGAAQVRRNI